MHNINTSSPPITSVKELKLFGMDENEEVGWIFSNSLVPVADYAAGIEITQYIQLVRDENGEFWRVSGQVDLPYVTTGAGIPEDDALVPAGDAALRQDLANPDMGAAMVARGAMTVGSIADLVALPDELRKTDLSYTVVGYHSGTTTGGGMFYWDATQPKSRHNGGTVVDPDKVFPMDWAASQDWFTATNTGTGCWVRPETNVGRPREFGAVGDGDADDFPSLRACFDAVHQNNVVELECGFYRITQTLTNYSNRLNRLIAFDLIGDATGCFIILDLDDPETDGLVIRRVGQQTIRNISVVGPDGCCRDAVVLDRFMRSEVENLYVQAGATRYGVYYHDSYINNIQIKTSNSLITGTDGSIPLPLREDRLAHPHVGLHISACQATRFDLCIEGTKGDGVQSSGENSTLTFSGTVENIQGGQFFNLFGVTSLVFENVYTEFGLGDGRSQAVNFTLNNCHYVDVQGLRGSCLQHKMINCSNIKGRDYRSLAIVGDGRLNDESPTTSTTIFTFEQNDNASITPVRSTDNAPAFLAYPLLDRTFSGRPIQDDLDLAYYTGDVITGQSVAVLDMLGVRNSLVVPQTNYVRPRFRFDTSKAAGRFIYFTFIFKKIDNLTITEDKYFVFSVINVDNNAQGAHRRIYLDDIGDNWVRVTVGAKLTPASDTVFVDIRGEPYDTSNHIGIELAYAAATVDAPSYSPADFTGYVVGRDARYQMGRRTLYLNELPSTGYIKRGDVIIKSHPSAGSNYGWVAIQDGDFHNGDGFMREIGPLEA